jgi:hypothetical protein
MPSTFTTSGVELIADGEQSGAWGQTTNVNLQIIDRMTSQAGTITLSGTTHTLTVSNGTLSDGQYNVLVFAGSPSGTNTVTINPNTAQRTFFVRNTTAQSVVLTQGSGGNVTVLAGTARIVYSNGAGAGAQVFDITNTMAVNTAATLQTARTFTIGSTGKTFDGSANVAWTLAEIGVNNATLTLATSGIATGSQTFTANQGTNATFTVNVPATNLTYSTAATTGTVNSSTGTNATIPAATTLLAGLMTNTDKTKLDGIAAGAQVNVATNLGYTGAATTGTVTSSTGTNATLPAATTSVAGLLTGTDKTKLDGIAAGAQVNVATNLSVTGGTTAGPTINSSTGTNATIPTASASASGAVTTGAQTFAGVKTFSTAIAVTGTSKAAGQFYAGTTAPTNTTRLNYDGALHATSFVGNGSGLTNLPAPTSVANYQAFTASGTWTKPAGVSTVYVEIWGGGASGQVTRLNGNNRADGAGGGGFVAVAFPASSLGSTVTVTVGAGGASRVRNTEGSTAGENGGSSAFGSITVGGGFADGRGGQGEIPGNATLGRGGQGGVSGGGGKQDRTSTHAGGNASWGGAGGGARSNGIGAGGTSWYGGNGGAAGSPTGTAGSIPGGGGGGGGSFTGTATSGAGGRGEVRVWAW